MPNYDYECTYCGHVFESQRTIKNRKVPQNECCPSCQNAGLVKLKVGSASIIDSMRLGIKKPPGDVAERLRDINKQHGGDGGRYGQNLIW